MEAIGDQLAEFGGFAGVFPRAPRRGGRRYYAFDDGTSRGFPGRLHPVPASAPASTPAAEPGTVMGIEPCGAEMPDLAGNEPGGVGMPALAGNEPGGVGMPALAGNEPGGVGMPSLAGNEPGGAEMPALTGNVAGIPALAGTGVMDFAGVSGLVAAFAAAAPEVLASADYLEAANFAGQVEQIARSVEYLQVLAAGAVDRTRARAITDAAATRASTRTSGAGTPGARSSGGWVTGWTADGVETLNRPPALPETDAN